MKTELPAIIGAKVRWYEGYANSPELEIQVDGHMPHWDYWEWHRYPQSDPSCLLMTVNYRPFVQFRAIADPAFDQIRGGALGGTYALDTGELYQTRSGWSSRASAFNKLRDLGHVDLEDYIEEVVVYTPDSPVGTAGFALTLSRMDEVVNEFLPSIHLITRESEDGEISFTPSTHHIKIQKPDGQIVRY